MYGSDARTVRIDELMHALEQSAKAHREAGNSKVAQEELQRWYSALRELGELRTESESAQDRPQPFAAAVGLRNFAGAA